MSLLNKIILHILTVLLSSGLGIILLHCAKIGLNDNGNFVLVAVTINVAVYWFISLIFWLSTIQLVFSDY